MYYRSSYLCIVAYSSDPLIHNPRSPQIVPQSVRVPPFFRGVPCLVGCSVERIQMKGGAQTQTHLVPLWRQGGTHLCTADAWERAPGWPRDHVLLMLPAQCPVLSDMTIVTTWPTTSATHSTDLHHAVCSKKLAICRGLLQPLDFFRHLGTVKSFWKYTAFH